MIRYLTEKEVILLNALMVQKYTPKERIGVKEHPLLLSALGRPQQSALLEDAYPDVFSKAAALYASIAQNHAFHSANKRTGFASMKQFLWVNGYQFTAPQREAEDYTLTVVKEKPEIEEIAEWVAFHSEKR